LKLGPEKNFLNPGLAEHLLKNIWEKVNLHSYGQINGKYLGWTEQLPARLLT